MGRGTGWEGHDLMRAARCAMRCVRGENHAAFRQTLTVSSVPRAYLGSRLGVQTFAVGWHDQGSRSQLD